MSAEARKGGPDIRYFSSNSNIIVSSCVSLKELIKINKENTSQVSDKLTHIVANPEVYLP